MNFEQPSQKEQKPWKAMYGSDRTANERWESLSATNKTLKEYGITTAQKLQDEANRLVNKIDSYDRSFVDKMEDRDIELLQVIKHFTDEGNYLDNWNLPPETKKEINFMFRYFSERTASEVKAKEEEE